MPKLAHIGIALAVAALTTAALAFRPGSPAAPSFVSAAQNDPVILLPLAADALDALDAAPYGLVEPVAQFKDRITLKRYGTYITPDTSPVEHDKFTGFHAGVDAEFTDTGADIPVFAIADGTVTTSTWMRGYGGVIVVKHRIAGIPVYALYGHLDEASLVPAGTRVAAGQRLGILGDDHSHETDGVRKHIHFSLYSGETMDYRGYVPAEADLAPWLDPLKFF